MMDDAARQRSLFTILTCAAITGIGWGAMSPLVSLSMNEMGASRTLIGLNTAMPAIATLVYMPLAPGVMKRFGIRPVLMAGLALTLFSMIAFKLYENVWVWFPIRFFAGFGLAIMFVATEVWVNMVADDRTRGRILGAYSTCLAGGFAVGVGIFAWLGVGGWAPFLAPALFLGLAILILTFIKAPAPKLEGEAHTPLLPYLRAAPVAMAAGLLFGALEMGILNLLPVYGVRVGLTESVAAGMLIAAAAGNILLQMPIGMLADVMDRRLVLLLCAVAGVIGACLIPFLVTIPWALYLVLFIMCGTVVGLYTVGLVLIGQRFTGVDLAGANAAFILMYGFGSLVGPSMAGSAMDVWDPHGLMVVLGGLCAIYVVLVGYRTATAPRALPGASLDEP